jgi:hypothetical protein
MYYKCQNQVDLHERLWNLSTSKRLSALTYIFEKRLLNNYPIVFFVKLIFLLKDL